MSVLTPRVQSFFERFPSAQTAYAATKLYHLTHSRYLPGIEAEGLRPNPDLFPADQGAFLLDMHQRYSSGDPNDRAYIQNRILDPSSIYLSTNKPEMSGYLDYGIPERLVFLMRGMAALATKSSLTSRERSFAADALEGHRLALTEGEPSIVGLAIDPLAPGIANNRLGILALEEIHDEEIALDVVRYVDGPYGNNIPVRDAIEPISIEIIGQAPITDERAMQSVYTESSWTASIR